MTADSLITTLVADLLDERLEVVRLLANQPATDWCASTPAVGWTVHDQVAHLARFDEVTSQAISDPEGFEIFRDSLADLQEYVDAVGDQCRHLTPADMLAWWQRAGTNLALAATSATPTTRVPWFGPPMSLASKLTARIMETWAHGQDIRDALRAASAATERLRHVARIGVLSVPNSFRVRGLPVPTSPIHVCLDSPAGDVWSWGEPDGVDEVRGSAEEFCLVVTQRRHVSDTRLHIRGDVATQWMSIAQAFAGPAGPGRTPTAIGHPLPRS